MPFLILPNELHIVVSREGIEENSSPKKMMLLIIKTNKLLLLSNYINSKTKITLKSLNERWANTYSVQCRYIMLNYIKF